MRLIIQQLCVPDYRQGLYDELAKKFPQLYVNCGPDHFDRSLKSIQVSPNWLIRRAQTFFCNRKLIWLHTATPAIQRDDVLVHEWNPRILSTWRDLFLCRLRGAKFILWGHTWGRSGQTGCLFRFRYWMGNLSDGVICYTESQAAFAKKMLPGKCIVAVPNACLPRDACCVSGDENGRDSVVYVGRIVSRKKVALLIEGFACACRQSKEFRARLLIVGEGPEKKGLEQLAVSLGVSERVSWLGHQEKLSILREVYERAFVSVSPGYVGLSLTQSFAFGVPALIARNEPHSPEIESANVTNSRFFASDDREDLAAAMHFAWHNWRGIADERKHLSTKTASSYSFEMMAERFQNIVDILHTRTG